MNQSAETTKTETPLKQVFVRNLRKLFFFILLLYAFCFQRFCMRNCINLINRVPPYAINVLAGHHFVVQIDCNTTTLIIHSALHVQIVTVYKKLHAKYDYNILLYYIWISKSVSVCVYFGCVV